MRRKSVLIPASIALIVAMTASRAGRASGEAPKDPLDVLVALRDERKFAEAETLGRSLLIRAEQEHGADSFEVARTLDAIVSIHNASAGSWQPPDLLDLAARAVRIKENVLEPDDPELTISLGQLANVFDHMGRPGDAIALRMRVLAIREKTYGPEHRMVARTLNNIAGTWAVEGDYQAARSYLERAIAMLEKTTGADSNETIASQQNLGRLLESIGDYESARTIYEHVLDVRRDAERKSGKPGNYGGDLCTYGNLLRKLGEFEKARPLLERSVEMLERVHGPENHYVGGALGALGDLRRDMGDLVGARALYERSLKILSRALTPRHPRVAEAMRSLAWTMLLTGDLPDARRLAEEALGIQERFLGPDHVGLAETLTLLARLRWHAGDQDGAFDLALRAEQIVRAHFLAVSSSLSERESLAYERVRVSGLDLAFTVLAAEGNDVPAERIRRAWDQLVQSRALVMDEMAARMDAVRHETGTGALVAALARTRNRLSRMAVQGPEEGAEESYRARLEQARSDKERAERDLSEKSARFRSARERRSVTLQDVAASLPDRGALIAYVRFGRLAAHATAPVAWYGALAMSSSRREPVFVPLAPAADIEDLVARWRTEAASDPRGADASTSEERYRGAAGRLRAAIWDPIASRLGEAQLLLIVPDGALHLVSFAALPQARSGYMVESDALIHYLSAERDLAGARLAAAAGKGLLVLGDPEYDGPVGRVHQDARDGSAGVIAPRAALESAPGTRRNARASCGDFRSLRFDPLPGSSAEVERIASLWKRGTWRDAGEAMSIERLVGAEADEGRFKSLASGHRILHLATHGFFMQGRCESVLQRNLGRAGMDAVGAPLPQGVADDPLLLSGLALAGANQRDQAASLEADDGILTAEEMASLDLGGTEWVVLSACETGLGKVVSGEGVLGVRRSLEIAGAETVIMSLWKVEDEATRIWMGALYEGRLDGLSTAASIRKASLAILESQRKRGLTTHPFFWAGFVAAGDWR